MTMVLALTWRITPADFERFERLYAALAELYSGIAIITPPGCDAVLVARVAAYPIVKLREGIQRVENRRFMALQLALSFTNAAHIHLCDGDHALVRIEKYPDDWLKSLTALREVDCLIVGRSPAIFDSYPPALRETERIINLVGSYLLGQTVDLGSGARGFSCPAVEYLMQHVSPETHGVATDAEYPVLLHKAGFRIGTYESDGAIYEVRDEAQEARLNSVEQWEKRVELAHKIIEAGLRSAE